MKEFINSNYMKWFRKLFLKYLIKKVIFSKRSYYLCLHTTIYSLFICWKDLKEVQNNLNSKYIKTYIKESEVYNCSVVWFDSNIERHLFLRECLELLNK